MMPTTSSSLSEVFSLIGSDLAVFAIIITAVFLMRGSLHRVRIDQSQRSGNGKAFKAKGIAVENLIPQAEEVACACATRDVAKASPASKPIGLAQIVALTISTRLQASKALAYYNELSTAKKHLSFEEDLAAAGSKHTTLEFYVALVQCAGRAGYPQIVLQLLDDMKEADIERPVPIYESAMRLLARHKFFQEAIQVYERLVQDNLKPSPVTMSCLVCFAAELGDVDRASAFFNSLCADQAPSVKACMSILQLYAKKADWNASLVLFKQIRSLVAIDAVLLNIVLATGVAARELEAAKELLIEEFHVADVVSHNTILKGLAQQGEVGIALQLIGHMGECGVYPNLVSFNTAMDATIRGGRPGEAWRLFEALQKDGLKPDKCTCSTLVKGFTKTTTPDQITTILNLIDDVFEQCSPQLRYNLLSGALDVSVRIECCPTAMRAFFKMRFHQISPSAKTLRGLICLTSKFPNAEDCTAVWSLASECSELITVSNHLKNLMSKGYSILDATRKLAPRMSPASL